MKENQYTTFYYIVYDKLWSIIFVIISILVLDQKLKVFLFLYEILQKKKISNSYTRYKMNMKLHIVSDKEYFCIEFFRIIKAFDT